MKIFLLFLVLCYAGAAYLWNKPAWMRHGYLILLCLWVCYSYLYNNGM